MVREKLVSILTPVKRRTHRCFRDKTGRPETSQGGVRKQEEAAWKKRGHLSAIALIHHNSDVEQALAKTMKRIEGFGAFSSPVTNKPNVCLDMDVTDIATTRVQTMETLLHLLHEQDSALAARIAEADSASKDAEATRVERSLALIGRGLRGG